MREIRWLSLYLRFLRFALEKLNCGMTERAWFQVMVLRSCSMLLRLENVWLRLRNRLRR